MSKYPFIESLKKFVKKDESRFFVPGHKGNFSDILPFAFMGKYDLTELPETDSLFEADGIIEALEDRITKIYGSKKSLISCAGSTLGIQTMLALVLNEGDKVLMSRSSHVAAVNCAALIGFEPVWAYPDYIDGLPQQITPGEIEKLLKEDGEIKAVYLTSPDYQGVFAEIAEISKVCKDNGVKLLVDAAHGAHIHFTIPKYSPLQNGADICVESFHKTLPALTGAGVIHINNEEYIADAKNMMSLFASTSPSYLTMMSIDYAMGYLESGGTSDFRRLSTYIYEQKLALHNMGYSVLIKKADPMRLTISAKKIGYTGKEFEEYLTSKKIIPEMVIADYVVLIPTPYNKKEDFERLEEALAVLPSKISMNFEVGVEEDFAYLKDAVKVMSIRKAVFSPGEDVSLENSLGRVAAQTLTTCPPGIPVLVPGEEITKKLKELLFETGISHLKVVK